MTLPNFDADSEDIVEAHSESPEHRLRAAWISEIRNYHKQSTGRPSNYTPGPQLDGGRASNGSMYKAVWPKLSAFVAANHCNAEKFIKAQFHNCKGRPPLSPNMLMTSAAISRYSVYVRDGSAVKEIKLARDVQIRAARDALEKAELLFPTITEAYKSILLDSNLTLSALFRHCLMKQLNLTELSEVFMAAAILQYLDNPHAYDEAYLDWIDDEFREVAEEVRAAINLAGDRR